MSGIAGIYQRDGAPADRAMVSRMLEAMPYRGPDGSSLWASGEICLGYLSLRTTPEAYFETQPVVDEARRLTVLLDGRLDNRDQLEASLDIEMDWRQTGDAQVLLLSYAKWGDSCLDRLVGDFAFAIWDAGRKRLFCGRDILGTRPFYYYADPTLFVFASEIHPIFQCRGISSDPNEGAVGEILAGAITSPDETIFAGVRKIPAATALAVSAVGPINGTRYWPGVIKELRYRSDQEYADCLLDCYTQVVRSHMRSAGPVGVRLSGGIDSGSIAALAQLLRKKREVQVPVETFSVVDATDPQDEGPLIAMMNQHCGLQSHLTPKFHASDDYYIDQVRHYRDIPEYPNGVTVDGLKDSAREKGFRVWLTGYGGGEWFTGSMHHLIDLWNGGQVREFIRALQQIKTGRELSTTKLIRFLVNSRWPRLKPMIFRGLPNQLLLPGWIPDDFVKRTHLRARLFERAPWNLCLPAAKADSVRKALSADDVHLTEMEERSDSRFAIEARHPLNDRRIVECVLSLPEDQRRVVPAAAKYVLRNAMAGLVPDEIRLRTISATGTSSLASTLRMDFAVKNFQSLTIADYGWVARAGVQELWQRSGKRDVITDSDARNLLALWYICGIETWMRFGVPHGLRRRR